MKTASTILSLACVPAAAGLAIWLGVEHQARLTLEKSNKALHAQLSQMDEALAENQRLSNLLARASSAPPPTDQPFRAPAATNGTAAELLRLRTEVAALRQQNNEIQALREDTRQLRTARESGPTTQGAGRSATGQDGPSSNGSQLEILKAEYWTAKTNMDVAPELRDRIRGDSLKAIASNTLKGDPDFGQVKHLTVVYRFGGVTRTNEFRENDYIVLPAE